MNGKELFYFTGKCLALDDHPELRDAIIEELSVPAMDWEGFTGLCSNHLILPTIYLKFKSHHLISLVPDVVWAFWEEIYQLNLLRNEGILKQLDAVISLLNENEISPTILKGAGNLLEGLYSDIGERMIGDIDMLVPEKDYLRAAKILENDGYRSEGTVYGEIENFKHYPRLFKDDGGVNIEIHRLLVSPPHSKWFSPEMIEKEKVTIRAQTTFYVLSDPHKAIFNFIHCQLTHSGSAYGIVSFRDIYDLYLISKKTDVSATVSQIKTKKKAISYFVFAGRSLSLPQRFYPAETFASKIFCYKHDLNQSLPVFYYAYRNLRYFHERILVGFSVQIFQSVYSKSMRRSVLGRLKNPRWYKDHFHSYLGFFHNTSR